MVTELIVAGALTVAWLLAVTIVHLARRPPEPAAGPPTLDLGPEKPAVVNLLTHRFRVTEDAVPATLLDLAARRFVELEHRGPDRYVCRLRSKSGETLADYERRVIELLRKKERGGIVPTEALTTGPADESSRWWRGFRGEVVDDAKGSGLCRDLLDKKVFVALAVAAAPAAALVGLAFGDEPGMGYGLAALAILAFVRARHPQIVTARVTRHLRHVRSNHVRTSAGERVSARCYGAAIMMARMQISLPPETHRRARARAAELGVSVAEYVRRLVARDLGEDQSPSSPHALFDLGDSGRADVARHKHRYVGEAVERAR